MAGAPLNPKLYSALHRAFGVVRVSNRGEAFRATVQVATLDPFHGYKNAIDDQLQDAIDAASDAVAVPRNLSGAARMRITPWCPKRGGRVSARGIEVRGGQLGAQPVRRRRRRDGGADPELAGAAGQRRGARRWRRRERPEPREPWERSHPSEP